MANVPFEDFIELLEKSQGEKATIREFPERSYRMVKESYFKSSSISQAQWKELYEHVRAPKTNFGG